MDDKGIVRDFVGDTLLSGKSFNRNIYDKKALENMIDNQGWCTSTMGRIMFRIWHQLFIDGN